MTSLSPEEIERYARHIVLKEIGGNGQKAFKQAKILVLGLGGLGAPAAFYLAAAGIGRMGLVDYDTIHLDNLQRQILYQTKGIGLTKVEEARKALEKLNPHIQIDSIREEITRQNGETIFSPYDYILDASDNFKTRHFVNRLCYLQEKPLISGAVSQWSGQLGVFKAGLTKKKQISERLPCYQCFVPVGVKEEASCERFGIIGALTGIIGAFMALEVLKEIAGVSPSSAGKIFRFETDQMQFRSLTLRPDPLCPVCGSEEKK